MLPTPVVEPAAGSVPPVSEDTPRHPPGPARPGARRAQPGFGTGAVSPDNVHAVLGVETVEATAERVVLADPVGPKVHQPYGILHGGVSALIAESAASFGAALSVPPDKYVVGIELNASHLRSMRHGTLVATATPVRKGRTVQVWAVDITDGDGRPICVARCTLAVVDTPGAPAAPGAGAGTEPG